MASELGNRIRRYRIQIGLSASALAKRAHIDPAALLRIERGENSNPSFATVTRIADALGISLEGLRSTRTSVRPSDVERIRLEEEIRELHHLSAELTKRLERLQQ